MKVEMYVHCKFYCIGGITAFMIDLSITLCLECLECVLVKYPLANIHEQGGGGGGGTPPSLVTLQRLAG